MSESLSPQLFVPSGAIKAMAAHAYHCFPEEACGLLIGDRSLNRVARFVATTNVAHSAKVYTIDPKEHLRAELAAEGSTSLGAFIATPIQTRTPAQQTWLRRQILTGTTSLSA